MVLLAKDIMDRNLLTLDEETDALTAARRMLAARKGYAVLTRGGTATIAGIVTEWDYLEKIVAPGVDPASVRLKQIASPAVHACDPELPMDEVASRMADLGVRRMIVRSGDQVVGVISSRLLISRFRQYIDRITTDIARAQPPGPPLG